jgi:hypothetical protein
MGGNRGSLSTDCSGIEFELELLEEVVLDIIGTGDID